ncbi:hypothetical protein ACPUVO_08570 [Pseudocolwellia sp. HL-MZ19]|uniref:hypothetical protein n=1 Tax=Pseudocolwellia sp. HL-MZ19 TaxID=3400846 RepID=UPI003CF89288
MTSFKPRLNGILPNRIAVTSCQKGAVLAEFIVIVSLVVIPLYIGLTLIAKYTDNAQKVELAARYSAWERTVWYQNLPSSLADADNEINTVKSATEIGYELENRVFSNREASVYIAQQSDEVNEKGNSMSKSYWLDNSGKSISIYKSHLESEEGGESDENSQEFIQVTDGQENKMYGYTSSILDSLFSFVGGLTGFDVDMKGAMSTTVNLTLIQPEFLKEYITSDMEISRSQTILADGWNAAGPKHEELRAKGLVLSSVLDFGAFDTVRNVIGWLPMAKEIKTDSLKFGHVVIDAVPESRLEEY